MDLDAPAAAPSVQLPQEARQEAAMSPDFVVSKKREKIRKKRPVQMSSDQARNWMPSKLITENVEFRSRKEQDKLLSGRKERIDDVTKQILSVHVEAMKKFKRAKKRLANLTKDEEEHPSERTLKDRQIVKRGPPITKEEARLQAYEQLVKFGW
jgi:hypothetical protein